LNAALPTLSHLIGLPDVDVQGDALWALSYLSDGEDEQVATVLNLGILPRVVDLLSSTAFAVQTPALRIIGNIASSENDKHTDAILDAGVLLKLVTLLSSPRKNLRKECCWTISNITAGTKKQIQAVCDANIIPHLVKLVNSTVEFDIRKEAAWALCNAASGGGSDTIRQLIRHDCIKPLCELLSAPDPKIIVVVIEGLHNILEAGEKQAKYANTDENPYARLVEEAGGLDKLEELQNHPSEEIYKKAVDILEKFYQAEEDDQNVAPRVNQLAPGQFAFGVAPNTAPNGGFIFS
jgi:importin subunit alpha-1